MAQKFFSPELRALFFSLRSFSVGTGDSCILRMYRFPVLLRRQADKSPDHRRQTWALRTGKWPKPVSRREKVSHICPALRYLGPGQYRSIGNLGKLPRFFQMGCLVLQRKKFA